MTKTKPDIREVYIPRIEQHEGRQYNFFKIKVLWECTVCGRPRGELHQGKHYDGSQWEVCDTWKNPCGHIESYRTVRSHALNLVRAKAKRWAGGWELSINGEPVSQVRELAAAEQQLRDHLKTINPSTNVNDLVIIIE